MFEKFIYTAILFPMVLISCNGGIANSETGGGDGAEEYENNGFTREENQVLDSLDMLMVSNIASPSGIKYADEFIGYVDECLERREGSMRVKQKFYGMTNKMTTYLALDMHDELMSYSDSVMPTLQQNSRYHYNYVLYLRTISYINQGKYRLAMQLSQELYNSGKGQQKSAQEQDEEQTEEQGSTFPYGAISMCNALTTMGMANTEMGKYEDAIQNYDETIDIATQNEEQAQKSGSTMMTIVLDAMSYRLDATRNLEDKERALSYIDDYAKRVAELESDTALSGFMALENHKIKAETEYAAIYCDMGDVDKAKEHIDQGQQIIDDYYMNEQSVTEFNGVKAKYYKLTGQNVQAIAYADSAATYFHSMNKQTQEIVQLRLKLDAIHAARLYSMEYDVANRIFQLSDSISDAKYNSSMDEMMTMKNVDKLESQAATLSAQRQMWIMVAVSVMLVGVVVVVLLNRKRDREKQKILSQQKQLLEDEVARQTAELREQKNEIEAKNKDITDSINYAERIQSSILPDLESYKNYGLEGAFAFFIPCNIVSGDFYWATVHDGTVVIACSDCTGHGVPGAFVSMIGSTSLNEISSASELLEPGEMLEALDKNVFKVLGQSGGEARDGMDIAIMSYDPRTRVVKMAGAKRPVYVIRKNGELEEYKGTKRSIGDTDASSREKHFETQEITVEKGDTPIYVFRWHW